jgi:hypothetical protein
MPPQSKPQPEPLAEILLQNALESGLSERKAVRLMAWKFALGIEKRWIFILGVVLMGLGGWGIWKAHNEVLWRFSEAAIIAGTLSVSVDLWLKRQLQVDAAKDIFQHLLGISLPSELRDKLQLFIEESAIYRPQLDHRVHVEDNGDSVTLTVEIDATNKAARNSTYVQGIELEEAFHGELKYASLRSKDGSIYVKQNDADLQLHETLPDEPMVWSWHGEETPIAKGHELYQNIKFTVKRARSDFYILFFGRPTISPTLRVTHSDSLFVAASTDKDTQRNGTEYVYNRVFLRGDHIQIRWRPK